MHVDGKALLKEGTYPGLGVVNIEERTLRVSPRAPDDRFRPGKETDEDAFPLQKVDHAGLDGEAAATGNDRAFLRVTMLDQGPLHFPEAGLSVLGENPRDRFSRLLLDGPVGIEKPHPQVVGELAPDSTLADAHEANQVQIRSLLFALPTHGDYLRPQYGFLQASFLHGPLASALPHEVLMGMQSDVSKVGLKGVMPTSNGCALFLGPEEKTFIIYVDAQIGNAISMIINDVSRERPMTHDLINNIFIGLGVNLQRVVINDVRERTFYARIILKMENEVDTKIVEIDSRPSDAIALALLEERPIYVTRKVLEAEEDMTELLERILKEQE